MLVSFVELNFPSHKNINISNIFKTLINLDIVFLFFMFFMLLGQNDCFPDKSVPNIIITQFYLNNKNNNKELWTNGNFI